MQQPFLLGPMQRRLLASTIIGPGEVAGLSYAPGLVERIVEDTRGGDALPLMAYTLSLLYQRVSERGDRTITDDDYRIVGGVEGALRQRADVVQGGLIRAGLGAVAMPTLIKLVALDENATPTRRRVKLDSFSDQERRVISAFTDARLVVSEEADDGSIVWVSHEALIRAWHPLTEAVDSHRDALRLRSRLERDAKEWVDAARPEEAYLLQGERLAAALRWQQASMEVPERDPLIEEFIKASSELRQRMLTREADLVGNRIISDYEDDLQRAIVVALEAMRIYDHHPRLHLALTYAIGASRARARIEADSWILSVALSRDASTVAIGMSDGRIILSGVDSTNILWERRLANWPTLGVLAFTFTSSDQYLVAVCSDQSHVVVLHADSGQSVAELDLSKEVSSIALTGDQQLVVAGGAGGIVRIWNAAESFLLVREVRLKVGVECIAISPDGKRLLVGGKDKVVYFVDIGQKELAVNRQVQHSDTIKDVSFSPDGMMGASASIDQRVKVWTIADNPKPLTIKAEAWMWKVSWSADGATLTTVDERYGLRQWNAKTGKAIDSPSPRESVSFALASSPYGFFATVDNKRPEALDKGHHFVWVWDRCVLGRRLREYIGDAFSHARFAYDDKVFVTRSSLLPWDGEIVVRDAADGHPLHRAGSTRAISSEITVAPNGRSIAIIEEGKVVCRSIPSLDLLQTVPLDDCSLVIFSPDGVAMITATFEGVVQRCRNKKPETLLEVGEFNVGGLGITPDGTRLLVAGSGQIRRFELKTGKEIFRHEMKEMGDLSAAIAPDGSCIAIAQGDRLLTVAMDGTQLVEFPWGKYNRESAWAAVVGLVAFTPDSKRLATASAEGWVYLWDVPTGELLQLMKVDDEPIRDLAFSSDGQELIICTAEFEGDYDSKGYAEIWPSPDTRHLVALASKRTFRQITPDERAQYGLPGLEAARSSASIYHLSR